MQTKEINQLKKEIENILNDNKAVEITSINLKDKTSIADFMIVASGNSSRHIQALSEILIDELKKKGINKILTVITFNTNMASSQLYWCIGIIRTNLFLPCT